MSYYYNYYIGYKKNDKIYPLGPYDRNGKLIEVLSRSASFASDLHDDFWDIKEEEISEELRKEFECDDFHGNKVCPVKTLMFNDLPFGSYIRSGFFLISDVEIYEKENDAEGLFYEHKSPTAYAAMLQNEMALGKPEPEEDCEGEKIYPHSVRDYMFYAYPDTSSRSYEAFLIREFAMSLVDYSEVNFNNVVILETEG